MLNQINYMSYISRFLSLFVVLLGLAACDASNNDSSLTVTKQGLGVVVSDDDLINCGEVCTASYAGEHTIKLTADPDIHYTLLDWTGCTHVDETGCTVEIGQSTGDVEVLVRFEYMLVSIYDITFEQPEHIVNTCPSFGFGPKYIPEAFPFCSNTNYIAPMVVDGLGAMQSQVLLMQPQLNTSGSIVGDYLTLSLAHDSEYYSIEMDMLLSSRITGSSFKIFLNSDTNQSDIEFLLDGSVSFNGVQIATYNFNEVIHLKIEADILNDLVDISLNDQVVNGINLGTYNEDLGAIRFYLLTDDASQVALDNINVKTRLNSTLAIPAYDNGDSYVIDFELPVITSTTGQSATGLHPYDDDHFNITSVLRRDPAIVGSAVPTNGSVHSAFTSTSNPVIYHKYGYTFQLVGAEFAQYSEISSLTNDLIFTGVKQSGEVLTHTIDKAGISMFFSQHNFPAEWNDLRYVIVNTSGFSIDNIVLKLDSQEVGYATAK